jgi:hypothetical protein
LLLKPVPPTELLVEIGRMVKGAVAINPVVPLRGLERFRHFRQVERS